jgi:uncharacterized membrane protein YdjX (TVP38/TMEM64 family)
VADLERPTTPTSVRIGGVLVLVVAGWLLFGSALSVVSAAVALIGYIIVAVLAFYVGRFVGRRSRDST